MNYSQASLTALNKPIEKLLIYCVNNNTIDNRQKIIALIQAGVDFSVLSEMACNGGVSSLVWRALSFYHPRNESEEKALRILQISHLAALAANSYYKEELKKVLRCFGEQDIPVIPLKGITLTWRLYGDIVSRDQSADTDLLVKAKDKEEAEKLLITLGYSLIPIDEQEPYRWYSLFKKPQARPIELHWDITMMGRNAERIQGLWDGTQSIEWEGLSLRDFKPEELLLYLCAHLASSNTFRQLKYACDINRLLEIYNNVIDWESLIQKASNWHLKGSLYAVLSFNARIFGINFPKKILAQLRIPILKLLFILIFVNKKVMLRQGWRKRFLTKFLSYIFFELIEAFSLKDYLRILRRVAFPSKEAMKSRLFKWGQRLFN